MNKATKNGNGRTATDKGCADRDDGAMSPSMRRLILSFGRADSERTWDPDAYTRRPKQLTDLPT
jgi:hypothetical protein